jgi:ABC-2 type transport system ATP-binding protein
MQRRIGLAQALINDPDLLILDEPTSGMDPIGTRQIKDLIGTLAHRGKTVLLSSHLLADVEDVCDRVCILYGGRQRKLGHVDDLLAQRERMQITTDRLEEGTLEKIRAVLAEDGKALRDVTAPRDKLESLFLRIVEEAQSQRLKTGGALVGGEVAEFLRGEDEGRQVIDQLVAPAPEPVPAAQTEAPAPPPRQDEEVLESLISTTPTEPEPPSPAREGGKTTDAPAAETEAKPDVDRGVLDDLLGGNDDRQEDR